jgi:hypothetical protein
MYTHIPILSTLCRKRTSNSNPKANLDELIVLTQHETTQPFYTNKEILKAILVHQNNDLSSAFKFWKEWMNWRELNAIDITEEVVMAEISSQVAQWRGCDKEGRRCCVVIGRNHNPSRRKIKTFKKFLIYLVEKGCLFDTTTDGRTHEVL